MQTRLPDWLKDCTEEFLFGRSTRALRDLYRQMGESYEKHGRFQPQAGQEEDFWLAYLAARLPATYAALAEVFRRSPQAQLADCESLFDLGSGPGTSLFAAAEYCPKLNSAMLVESDPAAAALYDLLLPKAGLPFQPAYRLGQIALSLRNAPVADLTVFGYALGELPENDRGTFLSLAWEKTRRLLVVLEPGTPAGHKNILLARDVLGKENAQLAAPCPQSGPCPLAKLSEGPATPGKPTWCHFIQRLERSKAAKIIKGGEYGYEDEKFSYAVFARGLVEPVKSRIIGWPRRHEGTIGLDLCQANGKLEHFVATRAKKKALAKARRAHWGDEWKF